MSIPGVIVVGVLCFAAGFLLCAMLGANGRDDR